MSSKMSEHTKCQAKEMTTTKEQVDNLETDVFKLAHENARLTAERDAYKASLEHIRDMPDYDQDNEHRLRNTARQALEGGSKDGNS